MQKSILTTLVTLFFVNFAVSDDSGEVALPEYIHVCHKDDPELSKCIMKSIEKLRNHLVAGMPEIDVPSIDPLLVGDLILLENSKRGFSIKTKNISAHGAGDYVLKDLKAIDKGKLYEFKIFIARLNAEGLYDVNGQFLSIPIKGTGKFTGNFTNVIGDAKLKMDIVNKSGKNVYYMKDMTIKILLGNGQLKLFNLFGGDKVLGEVINTALNQNFSILSKDLIPLIERSLSKRLLQIGNKITNKFTYEQLLPT